MSSPLRAVALPFRKGRGKILEIERLQKVYRMNGGFLPVLEEITFQAESGELICILGRSGCGKSTLLKIVAGFVPPSYGKVLLKGARVKTPGPDRCVIFQEDALFPWLTVRENIAFGLRGLDQNKKSRKAEVDRFLELVGLGDFRPKKKTPQWKGLIGDRIGAATCCSGPYFIARCPTTSVSGLASADR